MGPIQVPWPLSSAPGAQPTESAGRLVNCYAEALQSESAPGHVVYRRSPGLSKFAASGQTGFRGSIYSNNLAYLAFKDEIITVDSSGTVKSVGALAGTLPVTFAKNNKTPTPDIAVVSENGAFQVTSSSVSAWGAAGLPQPNSVSFQDGYFFFTIGDRRVFASDLNDVTQNASCYTTMQSRSSDTIYRGIPYLGLMWFFCSSSCEIFQDAGAAQAYPAFPYTRLSVLDRGLCGPNAVAGWEDGFGQLLWAADDYGVYMANGMQPEKVSPPDLDRLIEAQVKSDNVQLRASCYVESGHKFWVLSAPTWSWEFNLNTQKWNERWSIESGLLSKRWRADGGINAFNKWLMASAVTGEIVYIDRAAYYEEGDPHFWRMESGPVQKFPNRVVCARADFDFDTGVGNPAGESSAQSPTVLISWSDDGGRTWSKPIARPLGALGNGKVRVTLTRCGRAGPQGRRWRLDVSDGVYVGFIGATMSATAGVK